MSETPSYPESAPQPGGAGAYGYQPYATQQPQYPGQYGGSVPAGPPPPPPSNAGWAVAAIIFFWPLAFAAFNHVHDVYPKWARGDYQGAQYASDRAKALGKIALWIWAGLFLLFIVVYVILIVALVANSNTSTW